MRRLCSRSAALNRGAVVRSRETGCERSAVRVKFQDVGRVEDGLWTIAVLKLGKFNRCGSADKQAAKESILGARNPTASIIFLDQHNVGAARRRFGLLRNGSRIIPCSFGWPVINKSLKRAQLPNILGTDNSILVPSPAIHWHPYGNLKFRLPTSEWGFSHAPNRDWDIGATQFICHHPLLPKMQERHRHEP
jgi:hypothetical protein